jgi:hypothetical protein
MAALIRTTLVIVLLGAIIGWVYWRITTDEQARAIQDLQRLNSDLQQRLEVRKQMIERLSRTRRIAHVVITQQDKGAGGVISQTRGEFIELDESGRELGRQNFAVPGDVLFVDAWTVKFDHDRVAQGDPLAGRTLVLLRRLYSDQVAPKDGMAIDTPGAVPPGYACGEASTFEKKVWENFWTLANDAERARQMNVRVAQGEAVYKAVRAGQIFELVVDAAGGMSLVPLDADEQALSQAK